MHQPLDNYYQLYFSTCLFKKFSLKLKEIWIGIIICEKQDQHFCTVTFFIRVFYASNKQLFLETMLASRNRSMRKVDRIPDTDFTKTNRAILTVHMYNPAAEALLKSSNGLYFCFEFCCCFIYRYKTVFFPPLTFAN